MRPSWAALQRRALDWARVQASLSAQVFGPAFEELCRSWTERFAETGTLGGEVELVGHTVVSDPRRRTTHKVDVVVVGTTDDSTRGSSSWAKPKPGRCSPPAISIVFDEYGTEGPERTSTASATSSWLKCW